jgi:hypothetical protein
MSELKSVKIQVEGYGEFEIREPLFDDIEQFFGGGDDKNADPKKFGLNLLKKCVYKDGELVWSKPVGAQLGIKLMGLAPQVMDLVGFNDDEGKDSQTES